jgi:hypothetical protein
MTQTLEEIASYFDVLASDQVASKRWQSTKRDKTECDIRADVWKDAAEILRQHAASEREDITTNETT